VLSKIISNVTLNKTDGATDHEDVVGNVDSVFPLCYDNFPQVANESLLDEKTELDEKSKAVILQNLIDQLA
jgi:hypothetical protein